MRKRSLLILLEMMIYILVVFFNIIFPLVIIRLVLREREFKKMVLAVLVFVCLKFGFLLVENYMKRVAELERKLINYRMEYLLSCKILSLDYELTENQV